jgi:hypothetical protein
MEFQKYINNEIVVILDGVNGTGNIVWHSASDSWHIVWKETGSDPKPDVHITKLTKKMISEIEVIGNTLVLVHPKPLA